MPLSLVQVFDLGTLEVSCHSGFFFDVIIIFYFLVFLFFFFPFSDLFLFNLWLLHLMNLMHSCYSATVFVSLIWLFYTLYMSHTPWNYLPNVYYVVYRLPFKWIKLLWR